MASVSEERSGTGWKLRWRERKADGGWQARSYSVSTSQAATAVKADILRSLEEHGSWTAPTAPPATAPPKVADLERAALAWIEAEKARGISNSTLRTRGVRLSQWHRALRSVAGIRKDQILPVTVLDRQAFARATLELGKWPTLKERSRYDIICTGLAVWEWLTDDVESYPGLSPAPRTRSRVLPRTPQASQTMPAGTLVEMDAIVRGAVAVAREARAGSFVVADLPDVLAIQRYTGLRISSVEGIRLMDVFPRTNTLKVAKDKSRYMQGRTIPISPDAMSILKARTEKLQAQGAAPEALLFAHMHNHVPPQAFVKAADEIRPEIWSAGAERDGGRTTHCFRAALMHHLEHADIDLKAAVLRKVVDRLVGHTPPDVRSKHYVPPTLEEMRVAVAAIPPIDWTSPGA